MYVTPEEIAKAREIDAFSYLQAYDPGELVKCGHNEYCTRTHDSLKLSRGKWFWWSQGFGGVSALDYLVKVEGVDFVKAVKQLCGQVSITAPVSSTGAKAEPRVLRLPPYNYAADQVVKMSLETAEVILRLSGSGAIKVGGELFKMYKQQNKTKGAARLDNMLRSGKALKVYTFKTKDMEKFKEVAKQYGVLYTILKDKNNTGGVFDVFVRADDESNCSFEGRVYLLPPKYRTP